MNPNKRKRTKLQCLDCGRMFDDDYKKKHEQKIHHGKTVRVQEAGAPKNPFEMARRQHQHAKSLGKKEEKDSRPTDEDTKVVNMEEDELVIESSDDSDVDEPVVHDAGQRSIESLGPDDVNFGQEKYAEHANIPSTSAYKNLDSNSDTKSADNEEKSVDADGNKLQGWFLCASKLTSLTNDFEECKLLLTKLNTDATPNPVSFLIKSLDLVSRIQEKLAEYVNLAKNTSDNLFADSSDEMSDSILVDGDDFVQHDPGLRNLIKTSSQRKFLISLGPHQPKLPRYKVNSEIPASKQRQFCSAWFDQYPYLEYSPTKDAAFCFVCSLFPTGPGREHADNAWIETGVRAWHKMKSRGVQKQGKLATHFSSKSHCSALNDFSHFATSSQHVDLLLSTEMRSNLLASEERKQFHREVMSIIVDSVRTLARQGLPFRGDANEENSNFNQIMLLMSRHNPVIKRWFNEKSLRKYHVTYLSNNIQNEIIGLLAEEVRDEIIAEIKSAGIFTIMCDSTPDVSHKDQFAICARYVNSESGKIFERCFDMVESTSKTGQKIAQMLEETIVGSGLDVDQVAFQTYDYASNMSGRLKGTQQKFSKLLKRQVPFIPCQGHRVNTFLEHSCDASAIVGNFFGDLEQLFVFFSASTKRYAHLKTNLQQIENALQLRNLSKTRWTARAESIKAVDDSYEIIVDTLFEISSDDAKYDAKTRSTALALRKRVAEFDFIVCLFFMKNVMYKMKILTETLESVELNVVDAITLLDSAIMAVQNLQEENQINNLINAAIEFAKKTGGDPDADYIRHHRRRVRSRRIDDNSQTECILSIQQFYRKEFKEVLNMLTTQCMDNLRDFLKIIQPLIRMFQVPLNAELSEDDVQQAKKLFPPKTEEANLLDLQSVLSEYQILRHAVNTSQNEVKNLREVAKISWKEKNINPTVNKFCKLTLTAPVTSSSAERAFSKLKKLKSPFQSTMSQERLRSLIIIYCNQDLADSIDIQKVVTKWARVKKRRINL